MLIIYSNTDTCTHVFSQARKHLMNKVDVHFACPVNRLVWQIAYTSATGARDELSSQLVKMIPVTRG